MGQLLVLRSVLIDPLVARLSLQGRMLGLIACVCVALVGSEVWQLQRVHEANIQQADMVTSNTARSMAEEAETTIKTADTIVASLVG